MIVGIDLGTTNSLVAYINREGKPEIIVNERGSRLTPSAVYFKTDQEVLVGELARSQMVLKADRTVCYIKRHMGSDYRVNISGREYTPIEISALVLRKLRQYAEKYLGQPVEAAVVTVPAYFNDNQRQATLQAGRLAGLKILKLLNEPTAAALAYGLQSGEKEHVLVLDIGGGTFDITLMENDGGTCQVVAVGGCTTLGGIDFDNRLIKHILETFKQTHGIDLAADKVACQQVQIHAERAKVDLSTVNECSVLIPYITMGTEGPVHLNQTIRREEFEHLASDLWNEISSLILQTLQKAEVGPDWVDVIVMAGGASRMPGFERVVRELFGQVEIKSDINPDEVVALGAAIEAGILAGQVEHIELYDVTSHTLGIEDDMGEFVPIIPANTLYPVTRSRLFTTVQDDQEEVIIHILQRDELQSEASAAVSLGRFHLAGIQQAPAGVPCIEVTFTIDRNGVLEVAARDTETGTENQVQITDVAFSGGHPGENRRGTSLTVI
ncbi:MAG: Hsp70 family protein [Syntrophothermus sp.]|uniref:Hsp70 family protein n=1 Tax=Syntrophothermus sp. TaxID=2736299 RepID=UPI00257E34A9|nr:Hsp70 family protein [Syntrophothermus sp.]NSW83730.1 Hsp70 family protein [Syntrophothermus sp.]